MKEEVKAIAQSLSAIGCYYRGDVVCCNLTKAVY